MGISIRIQAKSWEINKHGLIPIKLFLTIDRKCRRFHLNQFVSPQHWIGTPPEFVKSKGKDKHPNARFLNLHLSNRLTEAQRIILELEQEGIAPNFKSFKAKFLGYETQSFFDWHEKYVEDKICGNVKQATIRNYRSQAKKLKKFSKEIKLRQITHDFITDYARFLKNKLGNDDNTIYKSLIYFRAVFQFAKKKKAVSGDPFEDIIFEQKVKPAPYLEKEEVERLMNLYRARIIKESWQNVLRMFLFACHSGLSYKDMTLLKYSDVIKVHKYYGITSKRIKTNSRYFVPLFEEALYLLGNFPDNRDQLVFNSISNQKTNEYLKEVVKIVKITKRVSFHTGRHSFGHSLIRKGIDRSYIKEILGHRSEIITEHYSKVMPIDVINNIYNRWSNEENR